jgi:release factor glutamine methyltransferase
LKLGRLIAASGLPQPEARLLAGHALGVDRAWLAAHSDDDLEPAACARLEALLARRRRGEPVAYITGEREFYGLVLRVSPAVLIPRPETELLVDIALGLAGAGNRVLDLGTGSGAIAIALAHARSDISVSACDVSAEALDLARSNAARHGAKVAFVESDWFSRVEGRFDLIAANPPYIASGDRHLDEGDVRFEPRGALVAGPAGMEALAAIASAARAHLEAGGVLLMEHGYDQGDACLELLRHLGFSDVADHRDLAGQPRVIQGRFDRSGTPRYNSEEISQL